MFRCVRCETLIEATADDPLVATQKGYLHFECFREETKDLVQALSEKKAESRERRSFAMRARWAKRKEGANVEDQAKSAV